MPNIRWLLALITRIHRWMLVATRGRIGGGFGRIRFLLLETVGRRSGRTYRTPLLYLTDDQTGALVVIASNAGDTRDPAWLHNLEARSEDAAVHVKGMRFPIHFWRASGADRKRLWDALCEIYPFYRRYERTAERPIPILVLEPRSEFE